MSPAVCLRQPPGCFMSGVSVLGLADIMDEEVSQTSGRKLTPSSAASHLLSRSGSTVGSPGIVWDLVTCPWCRSGLTCTVFGAMASPQLWSQSAFADSWDSATSSASWGRGVLEATQHLASLCSSLHISMSPPSLPTRCNISPCLQTTLSWQLPTVPKERTNPFCANAET